MATAPILAGDIKLLASKVMDDVPNGGGGPTGTVIPDGVSNAIFGDVTERARAGGSVSIRQLHLAVQTPNTAAYMDPSIIVSKLPNDANVSITLAKCDMFAQRTDIADAIENYLIQGPEWGGYLLENHVAGQRSIQIFQRPGTPPPPIGRTLVLIASEGLPSEVRQFVRVTRVEVEQRTFTHSIGGSFVDYKADVVVCDLTDALRSNFAGSSPDRSFARNSAKTVIRDTTVADAATFYGASPLTAFASLGDSTLRVSSVYTQLVPSARTESVALDQKPASQRVLTLATAPRRVEVGVTPHTLRIKVGQESRGFAWTQMLKPRPAPGTLVISYMALGNWYTVSDDGAGTLTGAGAGTVNYTTGSVAVTFPSLPDTGTSIIFAWGESVGYTDRSAQTLAVRLPEHTITLSKQHVLAGSLSVSWTSNGILKTASDNSLAALTGDAEGTVDYVGGVLRLRTVHAIDAGGEFSISYQGTTGSVGEEMFTGLTPDAAGFAAITLAQVPAAGTVEVVWVTSQEVSNTSGGTVSNTFQVAGVEYERVYGPVAWTNYSGGDGATGSTGYVSSTGAGVQIKGGVAYDWYTRVASISRSQLQSSTQYDNTNAQRTITINRLTDDGAGGFVGGMGFALYASKSLSVRVVSKDKGTSSYQADHQSAKEFTAGLGTGALPPNTTTQGGNYGTTAVSEQLLGTVVVRYLAASAPRTATTDSFAPLGVAIDLCPYTSDAVVPGSVQFVWMGATYTDFEGRIFRGATDCGSIDYALGSVLLTNYTLGAGGFSLQSLWTRRAPWTTASIFMRTQASPVKPSGFVMSLIDTSGNAITATAGLDGALSGPHLIGKIEYQTGIVELQFGDFVLDAALTPAQKAEWWYDADDVGAVQPDKIWRPWPVDPTTLRYNSVSYFYLPIDAEILGLDPVRLPQDGRVPIYRVGSYVVIGHSATTPPATVSNGQTLNCARTRLSRVRVVGSDGNTIHTGYTADLDAGTVTAVDVTGWAQPVTVQHRIEQLERLRDVQINGDIATVGQLSHDFPAGSTVSSAITPQTLRARVSQFWDQQTWDGISWKDSIVGNPAPATYNDTLAPVELTNAGALTERFALRFTNSTTFECIGEHVGFIGTGSINTDFAPINPVGAAPYFTLRALGWGSGWAAGNVLFIHIVGAISPFACIRTVQMGPAAGVDYSFELLGRGDVGRPPSAP